MLGALGTVKSLFIKTYFLEQITHSAACCIIYRCMLLPY